MASPASNLWLPSEVEAAFCQKVIFRFGVGSRQPWWTEQLSFVADAPDASAWDVEKSLT